MKKTVFVLFLLCMMFSRASVLWAGESSCRGLGENFSLDGVPGAEGWDQAAINCCPGLTDRGRKEDFYGDECMNALAGGYYGRCIACGDGTCDEKFESRCNCPEDCKD